MEAWRYLLLGASGAAVPVLFLDADLDENAETDRRLTDHLYGGDARYRLAQEIVLGVGGVRMLAALGYGEIRRFHMNEGHSSFLTMELLKQDRRTPESDRDFEAVRRRCVFTTHTPVPAGHDRFSWELAQEMLRDEYPLDVLRMLGGERELNMTLLALNSSGYVNGVARRHGEVSREMFPHYPIGSITNGVHAWTWAGDGFRELYGGFVAGWRHDPSSLRHALSIPAEAVWQAHTLAKRALIEEVNRETNAGFDYQTLTIGCARRVTEYKRNALIFCDMERLLGVARRVGGVQLVFAGKAHPRDELGKEIIRHIFAAARRRSESLRIAFLPNYDMKVARIMVSGSDLWLNTPRRPREASGTSGMKAAVNGVPQLSTLDGWWVEGHIEGITGWSIGTATGESDADASEARELYEKLEKVIAPLYSSRRDGWIDVMRHTIALNASFFNAHRMVREYSVNAYLR